MCDVERFARLRTGPVSAYTDGEARRCVNASYVMPTSAHRRSFFYVTPQGLSAAERAACQRRAKSEATSRCTRALRRPVVAHVDKVHAGVTVNRLLGTIGSTLADAPSWSKFYTILVIRAYGIGLDREGRGRPSSSTALF